MVTPIFLLRQVSAPLQHPVITSHSLRDYCRFDWICACVDLRVVYIAIFSSAFKAILLKHLFEKVFLLRSGRKRRTLGATVFIRLLFQL